MSADIATTNARSMPLVAIVTPVYNGGRYLRQTMESVQVQTYPNVVHVLLNNASSDNSAEIIESFNGAKVPILVFENESVLPLASNWNRAFSHVPAEAKYAKLLCADDLVRPDCIEAFVTLAESDNDIEVVMCQDIFADLVRRARMPEGTFVHDGRQIVQSMLRGKTSWLAYHHFFVRMHDDLRENFIDNYWSPDPHVVIRSALRGKFAYIPEPLVYNRAHEESVTGKELKKKGIQRELVHMHVLHHYGHQAFDNERDYRDSLNKWLGQMCRLTVRWRLSGQRDRADEMLTALREHGYRFSAIDYLMNLAWWPVNSVTWRMIETPVGPHIDEPTFLGMGQPLRR
jgi:glycosyltransferase involved in cell wall biosynthesis